MFEEIYSNIKKGYQKSWVRFFFKYTAIGKLLDQNTQINSLTFYNTCLSSWWWNRLWFRGFIQEIDYLRQFDNILNSLWHLENAEISTPKNQELVLNHTSPDQLACMLSYMQSAEILSTQKNFILVVNHANPDKLASALYRLEGYRILTQENFILVVNHANPDELAYALCYLQRAEILTEENRTLAANHASPDQLASVLYHLESYRILTQENFVLVINHANPDKLTSALCNLQRAEILTEENRTLAANHANPDKLASALYHLEGRGILTQENFILVVNHANPDKLASVLFYLHSYRILTQENFVPVVNHANLNQLDSALSCLYYARILTQANFNALVAPEHTALLSAEAQQLIWSRIPFYDLNEAIFARLVAASEQANPIAELQRVLDLILTRNIPAGDNRVAVLPGHADAFNQTQSTHTASVHRSVSASATRLIGRYGASLNLEGTMQQIQTYVSSLDNSFKHLAAKRCIARLTSMYYTFTDSSGVTTRELLALAYTAIHDETKRQGTQEDAQALLVQGLYEIQRGYNLNTQGIDNQNPDDAPICSAGTFNKLMEKLNGIHPDVEIYFITHEGLSLKFPKVVKECALNYLNRLASPETATGYGTVKKLLDSMKDNSLEPIWDKIKSEVEAKLWDEFKEAYANNPKNSRFRAMIEHGHDSNAPNLTELYSRLEASPGYQAFLYQLQQKNLEEQKLFLSPNLHGLWANRHHSTDDQNAFDREFALVPKP